MIRTVHLPGFDFAFTPAIQNALRSIDANLLARSWGGFGQSLRTFVALKTARRLVDLQLARCPGKGNGQKLELTILGMRALAALKQQQQPATAGRPSSAAPSGGRPPAGGDTAVRTKP